MLKTAKDQSATSAARRSHPKGKARQLPQRGGRRTKQVVLPAVLGGFRTVKLEKIPGLKVHHHLQSFFRGDLKNLTDGTSTERIYTELLASFQIYHRLKHGCDCDTDLLAGVDYPIAIRRMMNQFELMVAPFGFNVDQNKSDKFCFVIYMDTPWDWYWHVWDVVDVLPELKRRSKRLHDTFLVFIWAMGKHLGVPSWFHWEYAHCLDSLTDWLDYDEEGLGDEEVELYTETIKKYEKGLPAKYGTKISKTKDTEPADIIKMLKGLRLYPDLRDLITRGCELMMEGKVLEDYEFNPDTGLEDDDWMGLRLANQVGIMWDLSDYLSDRISDWLDMEAQNGHVTPHQHQVIDHTCTELVKPDNFTGRLSLFMKQGRDVLDKFSNERTNLQVN